MICNSPALAAALRDIYWENPPNTECIPYGFDLAPWLASSGRLPPENPPRIVFVGRLTADKGADDLVEILSRLTRRDVVIEAIGPLSDKVARKLKVLARKRACQSVF